MLRIILVDDSAEARRNLEHLFNERLDSLEEEKCRLLPRVTVRTATTIELKLLEVPSLIICGPLMSSTNAPEIANIRRAFPNVPLIAWLPDTGTPTLVDHLARMGCEDYFTSDMPVSRLFERLILVARRTRQKKPGRLILVDSAKGGAGVTTLAAGLAEFLVDDGKKVALLDLDFESQFLSRCLQTQPFVSEAFYSILSSPTAINEEIVADCMIQVWENEPNLFCVPPPPDRGELYEARPDTIQSFVSFLEVLDSMVDVLIIDRGKARGDLLKALYNHADSVVYVAGNDPGAIIGAAQRLSNLSLLLPPEGRLVAVQNHIPLRKEGVSNAHLKQRLSNLVNADRMVWSAEIPWSPRGAQWAGSGATFYSADASVSYDAFTTLAHDLHLLEADPRARKTSRFKLPDLFNLRRKLRGNTLVPEAMITPPEKARPLLPAATFVSELTFSSPPPAEPAEEQKYVATETVENEPLEDPFSKYVSPIIFQ